MKRFYGTIKIYLVQFVIMWMVSGVGVERVVINPEVLSGKPVIKGYSHPCLLDLGAFGCWDEYG